MAYEDNGREAAAGLSEPQRQALRRLLYDDMRKAAEVMSKQALAALDEEVHRPEVHHLYHRMSMMASILDVIGWARPGFKEELAARRPERTVPADPRR